MSSIVDLTAGESSLVFLDSSSPAPTHKRRAPDDVDDDDDDDDDDNDYSQRTEAVRSGAKRRRRRPSVPSLIDDSGSSRNNTQSTTFTTTSEDHDFAAVDLADLDCDTPYSSWNARRAPPLPLPAAAAAPVPPPRAGSPPPVKLAAFQCIICLDSPTDLSVTHCGHLFCSYCLHEALNAMPGGKRSCPVCRQNITGQGKKGVYAMEIKLTTKPRVMGKEPT